MNEQRKKTIEQFLQVALDLGMWGVVSTGTTALSIGSTVLLPVEARVLYPYVVVGAAIYVGTRLPVYVEQIRQRREVNRPAAKPEPLKPRRDLKP